MRARHPGRLWLIALDRDRWWRRMLRGEFREGFGLPPGVELVPWDGKLYRFAEPTP